MARKNNLFFIGLTLIAVLTLFFFHSKTLSREQIHAEFVLGDKMGFDLTPGKLAFGKIVPNYTASRQITVENNFENKIKIEIESRGEISDYIIVSENEFILNPSETKNLTFTAYTSGLTELRKYEGEIVIFSKKI